MRTASALAVCLLLFVPGWALAADDLAAALVARAGADVLGYLRVENPKTFLDKMDAVSARAGSRASDDLPLLAQRFLKNPLLAGIEMKQPWTFIFLNPQRHTNNLAVVVGVSDAEVFCNSFGKGGVSNVKADPATAGAAIRHFSETEDTYDHPAYIAALRAGKKVEPLQFKKQVTKQYYVTARDGQGLIVGSAALLDKLAPASKLGHGLVHGDLVLAVRMPGVLSLYEKDIRQQKESILDAVGSVARASSGAASVAGPASHSIKTPAPGFDIVLNLARQIAWFEAAAELGGGQLKLRVAAMPQSGSAFGRALAGQQPLDPDGPLMALVPANVAMLGTMRFTRTQDWTRLLLEMIQPALDPTAAAGNVEIAAKDREIFRALAESWGGGIAEAVLTPATNAPPSNLSAGADSSAKNTPAPVAVSAVNVVEVLRVTNAAQARQARRKAVEAGLAMDRAVAPSETPAKLKYETNVARHAGVEIDRITMEPAAPSEGTAEFIQQMAFVGSFQLMAQGPDSTNNIRWLITAAKKTSASGVPPALKAATVSFPKKHNGIFYMNLADYVGLIRGSSPAAAEDPHLRQLQTQLAEARVRHAGWLLLQPRAASFELVVPLDQLVEIMAKDAAPAAR
ncbi:MAG: hypothetical protein HZA88_01155 [Verrucomicrobia bacterium]|nr:hypothetical protein [Verrucomicrobiota bacterium]